jgi:hypothetical protein
MYTACWYAAKDMHSWRCVHIIKFSNMQSTQPLNTKLQQQTYSYRNSFCNKSTYSYPSEWQKHTFSDKLMEVYEKQTYINIQWDYSVSINVFHLHLLVRHISLLRCHSVLVVILCSQHVTYPGKEVLSSKTRFHFREVLVCNNLA